MERPLLICGLHNVKLEVPAAAGGQLCRRSRIDRLTRAHFKSLQRPLLATDSVLRNWRFFFWWICATFEWREGVELSEMFQRW